MRYFRSVWPVLVMLAALIVAPGWVLAHGGHGGHSSKSKATTAQASADQAMYRWKDDRGQVHYSQGFHSIPERFRVNAVRLGPR